MKRFRFSLGALMITVAMVGIIQVALWKADPLWASASFSFAIVFVATAILGAFLMPNGVGRAGWSGAGLFGAIYLTLCFIPPFDSSVRPHLLTSQLLLSIHPRLHYGAEAGHYLWPPYNSEDAQVWLKDNAGHERLVRASVVNWGDNRDYFERLCHSLFALASAGLGWLLGRSFWARGRGRASMNGSANDP